MIKRKTPIQKEMLLLKKQEQRFLEHRQKQGDSRLNQFLEDKIPDKLQATLEKAFFSAFKLIFVKGVSLIEKTYKREELEKDFKIHDYANQIKSDRKSLKTMRKQAGSVGKWNTAASGAAGIGMGLIGVGIPDIPVFTGFLLRSIYQISLKYGYSYETEEEKKWILLLIQGATAYGEEQRRRDEAVDAFIENERALLGRSLGEIIEETAGILSRELLYMKFLQGIPIVGVVGGAFDLKYMKEITAYAELKYRKRYYRSFV
ncbi:EcsC family protein [Blautia sp.]|uniref:EcsC protein family protein n=1 Tax=Blautia glucerasea TaxID=536633 RepID=A0A6N2VKQ0_9FIRM